MASNTNLGNTPVSQGYTQLFHTGETGGLTSTLQQVFDGDGTGSDLYLATNKVKIGTAGSFLIGSKTIQEYIQDIVGDMFDTNGSHTNITATYDDAGDGAIDLNATGAIASIIAGTGITTSGSGNITINVDTSSIATRSYVDTEVAGLVDSAPTTLDTLNELASALGDDPNFATTTATNIGTKLAKASNLSDLTSASTARTNLGVDPAGTDNSTNVTLAGSLDYLTLSGQQITRNAIDLTTDVTGVLPSANLDSDTAHLSGTQTFSGAKTFSNTLSISNNAGLFNLIGTDHAYIQYYPDGTSAGRKAYVGFGSASNDTFTIANESSDADMFFRVNDGGQTTTAISIDASAEARVKLPNDNQILAIGALQSLKLYHLNSTSVIKNITGGLTIDNNGAGSMVIKNTSNNQDMFFNVVDDSVTKTAIRIDASDGVRVKLPNDNQKLSIGESNDLELYHHNGNSIIKNTTGQLIIQNTAQDQDLRLQVNDGGTTQTALSLRASDKAVLLPYDNQYLMVGEGNDLRMRHNGSHSFIENITGNFFFDSLSHGSKMQFATEDSSGTKEYVLNITGDNHRVGIGYTSPAEKLSVNGSILISNNTYFKAYNSVGTAVPLFRLNSSNHIEIINGNSTNGDIIFKDASDTNMTIKGDTGNVGIGVTNPSEKLEVSGGGADTFIEIHNSGGYESGLKLLGGSLDIWKVYLDDADNNFYIYEDSNQKLKITSAGAITFNNAYTFPTSDGSSGQFLKTNGSGSLLFEAGNIAYTDLGSGSLGLNDNNKTLIFNSSSASWSVDFPATTLFEANTNVNNRILTATGATNGVAIRGEGNLTFDGSTLAVTGALTTSSTITATGNITTSAGHLVLPYGEINDAGTDLNIVGTNAVTLGTESGTALTIPNASTNVGIGDTNPPNKLSVKGSSTDLLYLEGDGITSNSIIQSATGGSTRIRSAGGKVEFYTGGANNSSSASGADFAMTIREDGDVGIGVTSPEGKVHIYNGDASVAPDGDADELVVENSGDSGISILSGESNGNTGSLIFGTQNDGNGAGVVWDYYNKILNVKTQNSSGILRFASANNVEAMRIDSSQNVGIGVNNPVCRLHIYGNQEQVIRFQNGTTSNIQSIEMDSSRFYFYNRTTSTASLGILNNGNVGIGDLSPDAKLEVLETGTGAGTGGIITGTATQNGNAGIRFRTDGTDRWAITTIGTNGASLRFRDVDNGTDRVTFDGSGNVTIANNIDIGGSYKMDSTIIIDSAKIPINLGDAMGSNRSRSVLVTDYAIVTSPTISGWYTIASASIANARGGGSISIGFTGGYFSPRTFTCDFEVDWSGNLNRCNIVNRTNDITKVRIIETGSTTELQAYFDISSSQGENTQNMRVMFTRDKYNPYWSIENPLTQESSPSVTGEEVGNGRGDYFYGADINTFGVYNSNVVFNEHSKDCDFRIETNNNANTLFIEGSTDRVAIGHNDPDTLLHLSGSPVVLKFDRPGQRALRMGVPDNTSNFVISDSDDLKTNRHIDIDGSGDIGIGTTSTTHKVNIASNSSTNSVLRIDGDHARGANRYALDVQDDDGNRRGTARFRHTSGSGNPPIIISEGYDHAYIFQSKNTSASDAEQFRIEHYDGNVRINSLRGDLDFYSGSGHEFKISTGLNRSYNNLVIGPVNNNSKAYIRANDGYSTATTPDYTFWYNDQCGIFHPAGNQLGFSTGAESFRIDDSRRVLIGGTSASGHGFKLEVLNSHAYVKGPDGWNGNGDKAIVALGSAVSNESFGCGYVYGTGMVLSTYKASGGGSFGSGTQDSLVIADTTGQASFINDVVAFASSDKRLKENIKPLDNALDKICKIKGVEFDWIDGKDEHGNSVHSNVGHDVGVIAQEIEEVLPEVVTTRKNGYKAVKYEKIVPLLIQAIKEQQKQIEELKNG